jgi:hypothetical protein
MERASGVERASAQHRSAGELVTQPLEQVSALVRDEPKLAQLEVTHKGKQAGFGIGSGWLRKATWRKQ